VRARNGSRRIAPRDLIRAFRGGRLCYRRPPEKKTPEVPVLSRIGLFAALAISTCTLAPFSAHAQDDIRKRGDRACGGDTRRMCTKYFQGGDMAILGCLQQNKVRLSGACRKFLTGIGQLH
jgi:hypothetical protein